MAKTKTGFEIRNRPDWLYNSLPYAYIAIGLVVMAGLGLHNVFGILSGSLFIATSIVVFSMRWTYRRAQAEIRAELAVSQQRKAQDELSLLRLSWSKGYESGNSIMDEQHHRLFDVGNALLNIMLSNRRYTDKRSPEIPVLLDSLLEHIQHHFIAEEQLLSDLNHPITAGHKTEHEHLLSVAEELVNKHRRGTLEFGDVSEFITYDLIAQHIVAEDKQYFVPHPEPPEASPSALI